MKGSFEEAVRNSLSELVRCGESFSQQDVIKNSTYGDGRPVGLTTIYKKDSLGSFVYEDLLREIKLAQEQILSKKKVKRSVAGEGVEIDSLKAELASLQKENQSLVDTIVEQEVELKKSKSVSGSQSGVVRRLELQAYVANALLLKVLPVSARAYLQAKKIVDLYELKYRGQQEFKAAQKELDALHENLSYLKMQHMAKTP